MDHKVYGVKDWRTYVRTKVYECLIEWLLTHGKAPIMVERIGNYDALSKKAKAYIFNKKLVKRTKNSSYTDPNTKYIFSSVTTYQLTDRAIEWLNSNNPTNKGETK